MQPFIVTLEMDDASFEYFNAERKMYFPAHLNIVPAHISMFHQLPQQKEGCIISILSTIAKNTCIFSVEIDKLIYLGNGFAYNINSIKLCKLRKNLAEKFHLWLSKQDLQTFKPHITVQNKVHSSESKQMYLMQSAKFIPSVVEAKGILLWIYLSDGRWGLHHRFPFH